MGADSMSTKADDCDRIVSLSYACLCKRLHQLQHSVYTPLCLALWRRPCLANSHGVQPAIEVVYHILQQETHYRKQMACRRAFARLLLSTVLKLKHMTACVKKTLALLASPQ